VNLLACCISFERTQTLKKLVLNCKSTQINVLEEDSFVQNSNYLWRLIGDEPGVIRSIEKESPDLTKALPVFTKQHVIPLESATVE
jgi:hypothetical protein